MECVWPLSPILMLFGSAIVVVLIKTSNTKLKGMEMELENKSGVFFILLPTLPLHLFFFLCLLLVFFVLLLFLSFIFSYFSSSFLPFFSFSSFSYVCFHQPFLNSLSPFHFLFNLFFLHNHHPISMALGLSFLTPQSRLTCYIFQLSVVGFCHASLCICPARAPYSCSFTGSITNSENLSQYTSVTITRYFSKFCPPLLRVQNNLTLLLFCVKTIKKSKY